MSDIKVINGNNRQIDLLAVNINTNEHYHVEVSVTHQENWCPTTADLFADFERNILVHLQNGRVKRQITQRVRLMRNKFTKHMKQLV